MRNGFLESPIDLHPSEVDALSRLGSNLGQTRIALEALQGSFVLHSHADDGSHWQFRHPTIGDSYSAMLVGSPDLIDVFIRGSEPARLLRQVTCGNVGLENAVVIPRSLYPQMLSKIEDLKSSEAHEDRWPTDLDSTWRLQGFLAGRCSAEFLTLYLQNNPSLLDELSDPGPIHVPSLIVNLAARLHHFGMLPDHHRRMVVGRACRDLLYGEDCSALNDNNMQSLFTQGELDNLLVRVREELVPSLEDMRDELESEFARDEAPDEYMRPFLELLDSLLEYLGDDPDMEDRITREQVMTEEWIANNWSDEPDSYQAAFATVDVPTGPEGGRSIFDDIDAAENCIL